MIVYGECSRFNDCELELDFTLRMRQALLNRTATLQTIEIVFRIVSPEVAKPVVRETLANNRGFAAWRKHFAGTLNEPINVALYVASYRLWHVHIPINYGVILEALSDFGASFSS